MATTNPVLSPSWSVLVMAGDEFLLTLLPDFVVHRVDVAILDTTGMDGVVADMTALNDIAEPGDGDRYLVAALAQIYVWDADGGEEETGEWVAMETLDESITVVGHALVSDRTGKDSLNRGLIGPGYVCARSRKDSLLVALTSWTPS